MAPELRALQNPNQTQSDILKARATQALTSPHLGRGRRRSCSRPSASTHSSCLRRSSIRTTRRASTRRRALTIGKRISERAFLTFSRSLNTTFNDQIIQLEFDASDRLYWLISRNEDQQTYAVEFRVRHAF